MKPEDVERERQRRERERLHSQAEERERQRPLAWPGGLAKEEPQQAPAAVE